MCQDKHSRWETLTGQLQLNVEYEPIRMRVGEGGKEERRRGKKEGEVFLTTEDTSVLSIFIAGFSLLFYLDLHRVVHSSA